MLILFYSVNHSHRPQIIFMKCSFNTALMLTPVFQILPLMMYFSFDFGHEIYIIVKKLQLNIKKKNDDFFF